MCPYYNTKPELCSAALASLIVNRENCHSDAYKSCPIFHVNETEKSNAKGLGRTPNNMTETQGPQHRA